MRTPNESFDNGLLHQGQLLRITYNNIDHQFRIVKPSHIKVSTNEIEIQLDGFNKILQREGRNWVFEDPDADQDFANAIGRLICLRYRL
ncbi:hypothetical protein [Olivibacter domesticus]|uniref:Uncharacterized protein n=1 Tax=Olivibacter domesticus TaxID=407022 RepID=A0A1H7LW75_OLID1|nr:hypothetical protein [Olivibacter domesticus]SEL03213.1 hypothetical protein SAMN05661044_01789 [Olivibacter domesticus]